MKIFTFIKVFFAIVFFLYYLPILCLKINGFLNEVKLLTTSTTLCIFQDNFIVFVRARLHENSHSIVSFLRVFWSLFNYRLFLLELRCAFSTKRKFGNYPRSLLIKLGKNSSSKRRDMMMETHKPPPQMFVFRVYWMADT